MDNLQLPIVNEIKVTGRAERILIDKTVKLWHRISRWTHASDVEFNDGKTAQEKVGNINGITSSFFIDNENISASSNLTSRAYKKFQYFTDDGKIKRIFIGEDGKIYIEYGDGADTVLKKLVNGELPEGLVNSIDITQPIYTNGMVTYATDFAGDETGTPHKNDSRTIAIDIKTMFPDYYSELRLENFKIVINFYGGEHWGNSYGSATILKYDQDEGKLYISATSNVSLKSDEGGSLRSGVGVSIYLQSCYY